LIKFNIKKTTVGFTLTLLLIGCGGFVYTTVGGKVAGLTTDKLSVITLADEANFQVSLNADGPFSFKVASNGAYNIRVISQPNPVNCTVVNGVGKMTSETPVTNIAVNCVANVPVGGVINGLVVGTTIGLSRQSGTATEFVRTQSAEPAVQVPPLPPVDNSFILPLYVVSGQPYDVTVTSQPVAQVCNVVNGKGTADNTNLANAKKVAVNCVPGVPVGVTLAGLKTGNFISLTNNGNDPMNMFANGVLNFNKSLLNGGAYAVTIVTQPVGQICAIANATGTAVLSTPATVIDVKINCI
jgi:hypothetical protein